MVSALPKVHYDVISYSKNGYSLKQNQWKINNQIEESDYLISLIRRQKTPCTIGVIDLIMDSNRKHIVDRGGRIKWYGNSSDCHSIGEGGENEEVNCGRKAFILS
jgi:hypothetical protein